MAGLSHFRFAAGVCVLTAGLLIGGVGGAIAVADPDASGSTAHGDHETNASGQQNSTGPKKPKHESGATTSGTGATTSGSGANAPGQQPKKTKDEPGATTSGTGATTVGTGATTVRTGATTSGTGATTVGTDATTVGTGATTSGSGATTVGTDATTSGSGATAVGTGATTVGTGATVTDVVAAVPSLAASVTNEVAPVPNLLTPVAGAVVPPTQLQSLIQDMLTSVAAGAVVALTQLQSDLYSFLLGIAGVQPVVAGVGGVSGAGLSPAAVASQWRLVLALAGIPGRPLAGNATGVATLKGLAASIFGATTQVAPNVAIPMGKQSFFRPASSELPLPGSLSGLAAPSGVAGLMILNAAGVLPVSLATLAALALPGAGGLTILTGAGVRIGYRQAKAGFVVQAAGIACFARPGPLGVVRSGSLIVVRPRALRVAGPRASSGRFDKVA